MWVPTSSGHLMLLSPYEANAYNDGRWNELSDPSRSYRRSKRNTPNSSNVSNSSNLSNSENTNNSNPLTNSSNSNLKHPTKFFPMKKVILGMNLINF
jgi:hypothetical protein